MIHTFVGNLGHSLIIIAFVSAILSAIAYWISSKKTQTQENKSWKLLGRAAFITHGMAVIGVVLSLFYIIYNHYYEYHYAWSHSSNNLPVEFMISCFWEGQEGSFLLWIFWHVLIGGILIKTAKSWESNVMYIFAAVQAFLVSMILGVDPWIGMNIGSDPFILLRDAISAPIFESNPNFVPNDGTGLNALLQNYWMVIHPPTLFLGFALTLVPFAFVIAGIQTGRYKEWIAPTLYWSSIAALVLGLGIMMGAYWAYETLNFGGYWNWDPVENASLVPWLILVAAVHIMIVFRKNGTGLKAAMILAVTTFLLVLYSTFLTRSGILGESSVHSFTDLGLSGQLMIYLFAFIILAIVIFVKHWNKIPEKETDSSAYSSEFWIFIGATVLSLSAFQIIFPTSIPVFNAILNGLGMDSNIAPPTDQVAFYTKFQLWFGMSIAILSGTAQFFFWKRVNDLKTLRTEISIPLAIALMLTAIIINVVKVYTFSYILLLTAGIFSVVSNGRILFKLFKTNVKLSGGAVTHIGIALMLIGILFSSGYEKIISINYEGRIYNSEFPEEMNKENLLLFRSQPKRMMEYTLTYKGPRMTSKDIPGYFDRELLMFFSDPYRAIAKENIAVNGETYVLAGDTIHIYNENIYYEIEYKKDNGDVFTLYPRIQDNEQMGLVPSPDIVSYWHGDLYTHITNLAADDETIEWSQAEQHQAHIGDTLLLHDFYVVLDGITPMKKVPGVNLGEQDVAIKFNLRVLGTTEEISPIYMIRDNSFAANPEVTNRNLGLKVSVNHINPEEEVFTFDVQTTQKDWIILKAIEKPYIGFLWIGTIVMCIGFGIVTVRRYKEFNQQEEKTAKQKETISA
ncbi:cytochrome c biogenesis protein CcsA [Algivirga pacifica]|uniref:Cytochrome c biogenesis protein CcsA n=1 Tax=Algivirga pacifica TaxID=1162670 RepID=A0ABP9DAK6_9BACT